LSETRELTGPLLRMIQQTGTIAFRMQSGRVKVAGGWMHLCPEGTADILCFPRGLPVTWIETKAPDGKTAKARQESQADFRYRVEQIGHRYLRVMSIDEGLAALKVKG
jgi:hypothetical protein